MRKRYKLKWLDEGDECSDTFDAYWKAVQWLHILKSRIMCGDKIRIIGTIRPI